MKDKKQIKDFAPMGKKPCEGKCDREVVVTPNGPLVICNACARIVMDNRK
jgi:hypothetical protein